MSAACSRPRDGSPIIPKKAPRLGLEMFVEPHVPQRSGNTESWNGLEGIFNDPNLNCFYSSVPWNKNITIIPNGKSRFGLVLPETSLHLERSGIWQRISY